MEKLPGAAVPSTHGTGSKQKRMNWIATRGKMLSSSYRLDQFPDPDGYVTSIALVLESYPDDVISHVTDPRTGIQRGCRWPPTIAEIVTACEVQMQDMARRRRFENWGKSAAPPPLLTSPREDRPTYEQLKAKYGDNFGITAIPAKAIEKAPSWQSIVSAYQADPDRLKRLLRVADDYAENRGETPP